MDAFATTVLAQVNTNQPFAASACYCSDGDMLEVFFGPDSYYALWVNEVLAVYKRQDNDVLIGFALTGITGVLKALFASSSTEDVDLARVIGASRDCLLAGSPRSAPHLASECVRQIEQRVSWDNLVCDLTALGY